MKKIRVIVIGGGPAGLMAAGQAARLGADVILLEKKYRAAKKLRITGKGRCNLTNTASMDDFIGRFGSNGKFLYSAFSNFFSKDLIKFINKIGVKTGSERGGRVFPESGDAVEIVSAFVNWAESSGVRINLNSNAEELITKDSKVVGVSVKTDEKYKQNERNIFADRIIIATGGVSYPATGSTGDGYKFAKSVGHKIIPVKPALVPLITKGETAKRLQGLSLKNAKVKVVVDEKKMREEFGEMIFTHFGVSGPIILKMSKMIVANIHKKRKVVLIIDLKPALDDAKLERRLLRDFEEHGKKQFVSALKYLLPRKLIPVCVDSTGIPAEKLCSEILSDERKRLKIWLKNFAFKISGHRPIAEAIVTAGGVSLKEVNPKTMESLKVEGLYFAGEMLDLDGETGGFNLQAAFSTGYLAGISAASGANRH